MRLLSDPCKKKHGVENFSVSGTGVDCFFFAFFLAKSRPVERFFYARQVSSESPLFGSQHLFVEVLRPQNGSQYLHF